MPAPPPNGRSSTLRWRSVAKSRGLIVSSDQTPSCSARPASEWPSGPGNISGNNVTTLAAQGALIGAASAACGWSGSSSGGGATTSRPAARSTVAHRLLVERQRHRAAVVGHHLEDVAGAEIGERAHHAQTCAIGMQHVQAFEVGMVELVRPEVGQCRARHEQLRAAQRLGGVAIGDPLGLDQDAAAAAADHL